MEQGARGLIVALLVFTYSRGGGGADGHTGRSRHRDSGSFRCVGPAGSRELGAYLADRI